MRYKLEILGEGGDRPMLEFKGSSTLTIETVDNDGEVLFEMRDSMDNLADIYIDQDGIKTIIGFLKQQLKP
jgi:hypothetical protein